MALTEIACATKITGRHFVPTADHNDWKAICTTPQTADTADLLKPFNVSRSGQNLALLDYGCTSFRSRARYTAGSTPSVNPVVQFVGFDRNNIPQLLSDDDGNTSFTLTAAAGSDLKDLQVTPAAYSAPTGLIDARNCAKVLCLVVTPMSGGGTQGTDFGPAIMIQCE